MILKSAKGLVLTKQIIAPILLLIVVSCSSSLERKILPYIVKIDDREFKIHAYGYDTGETNDLFYLKRIEVLEEGSKEPFQVFDSLSWRTRLDKNGIFGSNVGDYNFDGHNDFSLKIGNGYYYSDSSAVWLYDPTNKKFVYTDFFESGPAVIFLKDEKQFQKKWILGVYDYSTITYEFADGNYKTINKEDVTYDINMDLHLVTLSQSTHNGWRIVSERKTRPNINGELVEVQKSGSITGSFELVNFLSFLDSLSTFDPVIENDDQFFQYHESCKGSSYGINIELYKSVSESHYLAEQFESSSFPLFSWSSIREEYYSIQKVNFRNYGNDFTMTIVPVQLKSNDPEGNFLDESIQTFTCKYENGVRIYYFGDESYPFMVNSDAAELEMYNPCESEEEDFN